MIYVPSSESSARNILIASLVARLGLIDAGPTALIEYPGGLVLVVDDKAAKEVSDAAGKVLVKEHHYHPLARLRTFIMGWKELAEGGITHHDYKLYTMSRILKAHGVSREEVVKLLEEGRRAAASRLLGLAIDLAEDMTLEDAIECLEDNYCWADIILSILEAYANLSDSKECMKAVEEGRRILAESRAKRRVDKSLISSLRLIAKRCEHSHQKGSKNGEGGAKTNQHPPKVVEGH